MLERILKHAGFHKIVRGIRYNPSCLACKDREEKESMGVQVCPIGLSVIHCQNCCSNKDGECKYTEKMEE